MWTYTVVTVSQTLIGKEFHARGPATEKALSLRRKLVRGIKKSLRELERKRVSEQRSHMLHMLVMFGWP